MNNNKIEVALLKMLLNEGCINKSEYNKAVEILHYNTRVA